VAIQEVSVEWSLRRGTQAKTTDPLLLALEGHLAVRPSASNPRCVAFGPARALNTPGESKQKPGLKPGCCLD